MQLSEHELRVKPQHPKPEPRQTGIAPRISGRAARMVGAINFDDEPAAGADEVTDV